MTLNTYVFGRPRYRVTAKMVVVRLAGKGAAHLYEGQPLPPNASPLQVRRLLDRGMIAPIQAVTK